MTRNQKGQRSDSKTFPTAEVHDRASVELSQKPSRDLGPGLGLFISAECWPRVNEALSSPPSNVINIPSQSKTRKATKQNRRTLELNS